MRQRATRATKVLGRNGADVGSKVNRRAPGPSRQIQEWSREFAAANSVRSSLLSRIAAGRARAISSLPDGRPRRLAAKTPDRRMHLNLQRLRLPPDGWRVTSERASPGARASSQWCSHRRATCESGAHMLSGGIESGGRFVEQKKSCEARRGARRWRMPRENVRTRSRSRPASPQASRAAGTRWGI